MGACTVVAFMRTTLECDTYVSSRRSDGGHRHYGADAPATVARIRTLLAAGLPTKVIRDLMPCFVGDGTGARSASFSTRPSGSSLPRPERERRRFAGPASALVSAQPARRSSNEVTGSA
ncbi:MerR family transcriptional regulator [Actinomadura sp. 9N407]|uniref:MerR family transcriptional regulator n=1 Tax=Actinomadura sp. 9N407 TaxID=3375154 RepID=UPI0037B7C263